MVKEIEKKDGGEVVRDLISIIDPPDCDRIFKLPCQRIFLSIIASFLNFMIP